MASGKTYNAIDCRQQLLLIETKEGEFGGYKQDLLFTSLNEDAVEFYVCTKCNGLMRNACQIGDKQTPVCETCAGEEETHPMAKSRKKIPELRAKCPLERRGCVWKGAIGEVETHLNVCPEFVLNCTNACGVILMRSELTNHYENECQCREVKCKYCKSLNQFQEAETHYKICLEFPLVCPNLCLNNLIRKEIESHIENECPNTILECPYKKMGCEEMMKRSEVEEHEKIFESKHLGIGTLYALKKVEEMENTIEKTEIENAKLARINAQLTSRVEMLEEKIIGMGCRVEKLAYPIVLKGEISDSLIKFVHIKPKNDLYEPASCHNFWPNQIRFRLNFHYSKVKQIVLAIIRIIYDKDKYLHLNWPFRAKFKLTILDKENIDSSLVIESRGQELEPKSSVKSSQKDECLLAEIPGTVILENRFRNETNTVTFMLQMMELDKF